MVALPKKKICSVPLMLESVDLLLVAVIVAVLTLVLLLQLLQRLLLVVVAVVVLLSMLEHSKGHTCLAVDLTLASVLEVNRRHLMADSLLAIPFVNGPIHLYGPVAVNIVASNRLNKLASDHLANDCSLAAAAAAAVFGFADADTVAVVVAQALDQAEHFDSVFVGFDTTSKISRKSREREGKKIEMNCQLTIEELNIQYLKPLSPAPTQASFKFHRIVYCFLFDSSCSFSIFFYYFHFVLIRRQ